MLPSATAAASVSAANFTDDHTAARPRLYVVALAHLDTQWQWTERDTAALFLPDTVSANEALFERFPTYTLSFEGAYRYRLLEQLHPDQFDRLRARVAEGRWYPAGAGVEAFDTVVPAPESLLRQLLLGQRWFEERIGRASVDLFLPDCFGFPASLPTLAAHAGLLGFVTQKLRRGDLLRAARPIPFAYGRWRGGDGAEILAALDPGEYSAQVTGDLSRDPEWLARFEELRRAGHPQKLLRFVGIGDRGGAPPADSIAALEAAQTSPGPVEVRHGGADRIHLETTAAERARLPVYEGDLLLRLHGTGCYSSQLAMKRWNRSNERRARAAEAAAVLAARHGRPAPRQRLEAAWWRFLAHQMHDDLTGTSIPAAYEISLADEALAAAEFDGITADSLAALLRQLGRPAAGTAVLLFNPLGAARDELVELPWPEAGKLPLEVVDPYGRVLPTQVGSRSNGRTLLFPARLAALSAAVFVVRPGGGSAPEEPCAASAHALSGARLRARFDAAGRLASLESDGRQWLAAPSELQSFANRSRKYPAWEIRWEDLAVGPLARGGRLVSARLVEPGPLRATLEFEHALDGQRVRERWSLAAGPSGDRLECELQLDARRSARLLKYTHQFAFAADGIACDLGIGIERRPAASAALYEVPAQRFAALEDRAGDGGVAVLSDVLAGWDHPPPSTLRLTCLHAPRASFKWRHQRTQDLGRHALRFALAPFSGRADDGSLAARADRFAEPPLALRGEDGPALAGPTATGLEIDAGPAQLLALKPAHGKTVNEAVLRLANPTDGALEVVVRDPQLCGAIAVDGCERPLRQLPVTSVPEGELRVRLPARGLASVQLAFDAARPAPAPREDWTPAAQAVLLPLELSVFLGRGERSRSKRRDDGFDGRRFLPREQLPARLDETTVPFSLAHVAAESPDATPCRGQMLELPPDCAELWLLGAAAGRRREVEFRIDERPLRVAVAGWREPLFVPSRRRPLLLGGGIVEEQVRTAACGWIVDFLRDRDGRELPGERALLAQLRIPIAGARRLRLPDCPAVRLVAATAVARPAQPGTLLRLHSL